ncbi:hypothetical protein F53441_9700 [Fusarium austroafricanum]|uniref:Ecp2 effector protein domain-containing protein n=1 Tax=Fusarium austroafricanum TaxID=2364996 RepID=A0A8H4KB67_9HYPO|nr:hypothetical protein F53441_9700 [Fusarium austroafricanum]
MPSITTLSLMIGAIAAPVSASTYPATVPSGFFSGPRSDTGSWYHATANQDATNRQSWCGYKYYNSDPIIAVAMGGATWSSNPTAWRDQTRKHCGLEAKATDPDTGKSKLMYIGDAFDDSWVRSPGSIDIMIEAFSAIHGNPNGDKNKVIEGVKWELTGNVNTQYATPGANWPVKSSSDKRGSGSGSE